MKFCKNLQRIVEISDPAYSAFFVNYRMLKKLIKELPSLVPADETGSKSAQWRAAAPSSERRPTSPDFSSEELRANAASPVVPQQRRGDTTKEMTGGRIPRATSSESAPDSGTVASSVEQRKEELGKSPGEIAFFKLLHSEFKKATKFFEKAQLEFEIREQRVLEGMAIMKQPNAIMVNEKWSTLAKSIFQLYRDLLLLETYAIMAYCSFSKILKKHDKVTGHDTRMAFMTNVVNKANFTNYPKVLAMINRCEGMYDEVSELLVQEGKQGLYEDERLFISMISRLNEQVLVAPDGPGSGGSERMESRKVAAVEPRNVTAPARASLGEALATLQTLVRENDALANAAQVSEGHLGDEATGDYVKQATEDDRKRPAMKTEEVGSKKMKAE